MSDSAELEVKGEELLRKLLKFKMADLPLRESRLPDRSVRFTSEDSSPASPSLTVQSMVILGRY